MNRHTKIIIYSVIVRGDTVKGTDPAILRSTTLCFQINKQQQQQIYQQQNQQQEQ